MFTMAKLKTKSQDEQELTILMTENKIITKFRQTIILLFQNRVSDPGELRCQSYEAL